MKRRQIPRLLAKPDDPAPFDEEGLARALAKRNLERELRAQGAGRTTAKMIIAKRAKAGHG